MLFFVDGHVHGEQVVSYFYEVLHVVLHHECFVLMEYVRTYRTSWGTGAHRNLDCKFANEGVGVGVPPTNCGEGNWKQVCV